MNARDSIYDSVRKYLNYLIESDIHDIYLSPVKAPAREKLEDIEIEFQGCTRCGLARDRNHLVFGSGNKEAHILFVIDGPNEQEDNTGKMVQGEQGELLTNIINKGMNLSLSEIYICPIVKCRPADGRPVSENDMQACLPVLQRQIAAINPKVIVTLGAKASHFLLKNNTPIEELRGTWQNYRGIAVMPTFHPTYVLQNYFVPVRKRVWGDVQAVIAYLDNLSSKR